MQERAHTDQRNVHRLASTGRIACAAVIFGWIAVNCGGSSDVAVVAAGGGGGSAGTNIGNACSNNNPCPTGYACRQGSCEIRCGTGQAPCPLGTTCGTNGNCVPTPGGAGGAAAGGAPGGGTSGSTGSVPIGTVPADFVPAEGGGYKLGPQITGNSVAGVPLPTTSQGCSIFVGIARDFMGSDLPNGHPDFQSFAGTDATTRLVASTIGTDQKPVYASQCGTGMTRNNPACPFGQQTTTQANYDQWYRTVDGVNIPYAVFLALVPRGTVYTFESHFFFPLDGAGWVARGQEPARTADDNQKHNFNFTTEVHTKFVYNGGENFTFTGDDDVWVFINGRLAVDLGGLHRATSSSLDLDRASAALQLTRGTEYPLELFHAERHTNQSNFRIDTNISFTDCGGGGSGGGGGAGGAPGSGGAPGAGGAAGGGACVADGQACQTGADCCSGSCVANICQSIIR